MVKEQVPVSVEDSLRESYLLYSERIEDFVQGWEMSAKKALANTLRFFRKPTFITAVGTVVVIALLYLFYPPFGEFLINAWDVLSSSDRDRIAEWTAGFGIWGPVIFMGLFLVQMFAFFLPSWLLIVAGVVAFGPFMGGILSLGGITLAAAVAYLIGRVLGEPAVRKLFKEEAEEKMRFYLSKYGFWLIVVFRLAPFLSNDIISFVAGLSLMRFSLFMVATAVGISPLIALIAYLGETNERLINGFIVVSIISIVGLALYVWWDRRHIPKHRKEVTARERGK